MSLRLLLPLTPVGSVLLVSCSLCDLLYQLLKYCPSLLRIFYVWQLSDRYSVSEMTHFIYLFWFWKLAFFNYKLHMKFTFFAYQQMFFLVYLSVLETCLPPNSVTVLVSEGMHTHCNTQLQSFYFFLHKLNGKVSMRLWWRADLTIKARVVSLLSCHLMNCGWWHLEAFAA